MSCRRVKRLGRVAAVVACAAIGGLIVRWVYRPSIPPATISDIQGARHRSPLENVDVLGVEGVVTTVDSRGFYLQSTHPDSSAETSEGVYIFTAGTPGSDVASGALVRVRGRVVEYVPSARRATDLTVTQIAWPEIELAGLARVPDGVSLNCGGRLRSGNRAEAAVPCETMEDDARGRSVERADVRFDPNEDALDRLESLEGMRIRIERAIVVAPAARRRALIVSPEDCSCATRTSRGSWIASPHRRHPLRFLLLSEGAEDRSELATGARLLDVDATLDYRFGQYALLERGSATIEPATIPPESAVLSGDATHWTIASFNLHNLGPGDRRRMVKIARQIASVLRAPDLVAVQEITDRSGAENDGRTGGDETFRRLTAAIAAAGGPDYDHVQIDPPRDGADGGRRGTNIRTGFLYRRDRVRLAPELTKAVFRVARGRESTAARPANGPAAFRLFDGTEEYSGCRKPLVAGFDLGGESILFVNVHLRSRYGAEPEFGRRQPPFDPTAVPRARQIDLLATVLREVTRTIGVRIVVLGDFNTQAYSPALRPLTGEESARSVDGFRLVHAANRLAPADRYTYNHRGVCSELDHVLVSPAFASRIDCDIVHVNVDFPNAASDHDPVVVRLRVEPSSAPLRSP